MLEAGGGRYVTVLALEQPLELQTATEPHSKVMEK